MLTADLVRARPRAGRLQLRALSEAARARALELARDYLSLAKAHGKDKREDFDARLAEREVASQDRRLAEGLAKLVRDRCRFEMEAPVDPTDLRRELFREASEQRRAALLAEGFRVQDVIEVVAGRFGLSAAQAEDCLYADLKGAHRLVSFEAVSPAGLLDLYERGQVQAVLLKATSLRVRLPHAARSPVALRGLFRKLKFLRLLHVIRRAGDEGRDIEIDIDGPYSLFGSVTKYGLQLAMLVPALDAFGAWQLEAEVLWGLDKQRLDFSAEGPLGRSGRRRPGRRAEPLPEEVARLVEGFQRLESSWRVEVAAEVLDLPGLGLSVPDLVFYDEQGGERVFLEVMGFWSREAVWHRVELVEAGLPERIIFAVSERLRVSEAVLPAGGSGALLVYKGVMSPKRVLEKLQGGQVAS